MAYYRYLVANCDIPAENIRAGDLIEIPLGTHEPIGSYRKHGQNHGRFLGYEADGQLTPAREKPLHPVTDGDGERDEHARFR